MAKSLANTRCFLLDMDGTFYLGDHLLEGSLEFIETLAQLGLDYCFLTNNSSQSRLAYVSKLRRMGLSLPESHVFTSGEAAALYLQGLQPTARLYLVGTPDLEAEFQQAGFVLDDSRPDWAVLGFDTTLTYEKLWKLCNLVRAGLPYLATHPDFNCPAPGGFKPDIGAMIAFVKASTGREPDIVVGKPNRLIAEMAARKVGLPLEALAMIGDRLYTDIALGVAASIPSILVLCGETQAADLAGAPYQPDYVFDHLGAFARWLKEKILVHRLPQIL